MARKITVEIVGDASKLQRSFGQASKSAAGFNRNLSQSGRGALTASVGFRGLARSIAFTTSALVAGGGLVAALKGAVGEFQESAKVSAKTAAVLKSTGGAANVTARQVQDLADELLRKTGIDDEAIRSAQNVLLTFTQVRNEIGAGNDVFAQATRAAVDMSAALGTDLQGSIIQVGKALNDPIKGVTALRRVGVSFTESQQKQIKALVESGQLLDAQKFILRELRTEFEGQAEAVGHASLNFSILIETVRNLASDLVSDYAPAINQARDRLTAWVQDTENQRRVIDAVRGAITAASNVVKSFVPVVQDGARVAKAFAGAVGGAANAVQALAAAAVSVKLAGLIGGLTSAGTAAGTAQTKVAALRASLLALPAAIAVTVAVGVIFNRKAISKAGENFLRENGLGFLAGGGTADSFAELPSWAKAEFNRRNQLGRRFDSVEGLRMDRATFQARRPATGGTAGGGSAGRRLTGLATVSAATRNALALAQARTPGAELAALGEQQRLIQQQIAKVTAQLRGATGQKAEALAQTLEGLYSEQASALARIQSINSASARDAQQKADRAKATSEKRRDAIRDMVAAAVGGVDLGVAGGPLTLARIRRATAQGDAAAAQTRQFRALGLTGTGGDRAPGTGGLLRITEQLLGRADGGGKIESRLKVIRDVIADNFKGMSDDVRRTIRGMLDDIDHQLGQRVGPITKGGQISSQRLARILTTGAGIDAAAFRAIRQNVSGLSITQARGGLATSAGRLDLHSHVYIDNREVGRAVNRDAAKTRHRTARQTSGWSGG